MAGRKPRPEYSTLRYAVDDRIATITLDRPERLNAINDAMPGEHGFAAAVEWRDSGRPLPELKPGDDGSAFMAAPKAGARSQWSTKQRRSGKATP